MGIYLTVAAIALASAGLVVGIVVLLLLINLAVRFDAYGKAIADLQQAGNANTKEVGERVAANQSLLRKRIDRLEDEIKRHSSRIDLFKRQVSAEVSAGIDRLDERISTIVDEDGGRDSQHSVG